MSNKPLSLVITLLAVGVVAYYIINIYELVAKTYYVDEADLYRIDTFHLLGRAYEETKYAGQYSSVSDLAFQSTNRYSFSIADKVFLAIKDKQKLKDTLMYHDTKFTIFSNKENYTKYRNSKEPIFLEVYQIQIGNIKYIDNSFLNKLLKGNRLVVVFCMPLAVFFLAVLVYKTSGSNQWTARKMNLFAVGCFLVFMVTVVGVIIFS